MRAPLLSKKTPGSITARLDAFDRREADNREADNGPSMDAHEASLGKPCCDLAGWFEVYGGRPRFAKRKVH
ncbi:MAG: hypothetical protein ACTHM8_09490 [Sphingomonas sp.]